LQSNLLEHKIAFAEICKGYSPRKLDGNDVFVKHPTEDDYLDLDLLHTKVKEECEAKGLPFEAEKLKEASTPVRGDFEKVKHIATVSSNNDTFIGGLITEAFEKIGFDGVIEIEKSNTTETSVKVSEGLIT